MTFDADTASVQRNIVMNDTDTVSLQETTRVDDCRLFRSGQADLED